MRDTMGPARPSDQADPQRGEDSGPAAAPKRPKRPAAPSPGRPISARETTPPPARDLERASAPSEATRDVQVDEETWTVRQKGAASVGSGYATARILSVGFEAPGKQRGTSETRYVLARRLEDVGEDELVSLVREVAQHPDATSGHSARGSRIPGRGRGRRRERP